MVSLILQRRIVLDKAKVPAIAHASIKDDNLAALRDLVRLALLQIRRTGWGLRGTHPEGSYRYELA
jgi:hypothetical protein